MTAEDRILVVGAGAIGTATALHLAWRGHDVTVLDADGIAARTTGLAAGILSLGVVDDVDRRMVQATLTAFDAFDAQDVRERTANRVEGVRLMRRPGSQILVGRGGPSDLLRHIVRDTLAMGRGANLWDRPRWLDDAHTRGLAANARGLETIASLPGDAWTLSTDATHRMAAAAKQAGVRFKAGATVERLIRDGAKGPVVGVALRDGTEVRARATVVAAGAWTPKLLEQAGLRVPIRPYRTHAAILETPHAQRFPILHDDVLGYYLRPEGPRHLLVGDGTRTDPTDPDAMNNEAEASFLSDIAERIPQRFPDLAEAGLQNAWRGVLSGTPDRGPLLGPHPDARGLVMATGGNGFGFMRSWAIGATVVALMEHASILVPSASSKALPPGMPKTEDAVDHRWLDRCNVARFWPDPPTEFSVTEGFTLDV